MESQENDLVFHKGASPNMASRWSRAGFLKVFASAWGFCFPRLLSCYYWRGLVYFKTADPLRGDIKVFSETVWHLAGPGAGSEWFIWSLSRVSDLLVWCLMNYMGQSFTRERPPLRCGFYSFEFSSKVGEMSGLDILDIVNVGLPGVFCIIYSERKNV